MITAKLKVQVSKNNVMIFVLVEINKKNWLHLRFHFQLLINEYNSRETDANKVKFIHSLLLLIKEKAEKQSQQITDDKNSSKRSVYSALKNHFVCSDNCSINCFDMNSTTRARRIINSTALRL